MLTIEGEKGKGEGKEEREEENNEVKYKEEKNNFINIEKKETSNEILEYSSFYNINCHSVINLLINHKLEEYEKNIFSSNIILILSKLPNEYKLYVLYFLYCYYNEKGNNEQLYYIIKKLDKVYNKSFAESNHLFLLIEFYNKIIENLNKNDMFIYAYNYMLKCKELIKDNDYLKSKIYSEVENHYKNYLESCEKKFQKEFADSWWNFCTCFGQKKENLNEKLIQLINSLINGNYIFNNKKDDKRDSDYLYAISKNWLLKAYEFILILESKQNIKTFFKQAFKKDYVYEFYFNKKKQIETPFPGPINNFEITSFKYSWIINKNLDGNYFIKKNLKNEIDYYLINYEDWDLIKSFFGATNEIKRKKGLDLVALKIFFFDKIIKYNDDDKFLIKQIYIQLENDSKIKELKEKIINKIKRNLKYIKKKNLLIKNINFYIIDKDKEDLLIEIFSFINNKNLGPYESIFIKALELKDENTLTDLFNQYDKEKHLLIIEIYDKTEDKIFEDLKFNRCKCSICGDNIDSEHKYTCNKCNYSLFCSQTCAKKSKNHLSFHYQLSKIFLEESKLKEGKVGLKNLDNTCYFNSVIQCLSNTEPLKKFFLDFDGSYDKEISVEYSKLINEMWKGTSDYISPSNFLKICGKYIYIVIKGVQNDSHEFLSSLLYLLSLELKWKNNEDSIITDLFRGQEKKNLKCMGCNTTRNNFDTFLSLSLPINNLVQFIFLTSNLVCIDISMEKKETLQIKDMINKIFDYINEN